MNISQLDLRWASSKLGASPLTVGHYGCTTSCVSMVSADLDCYKSPLDLAKNAANYTDGGLIIWNNLNKVFEGKMRFVWRGYGYKGPGRVSEMRDFDPLHAALNSPLQRVILQVNNGEHWVKLEKKNVFGNDWTAIDPLGGVSCQVLAKYKNITGYAIFEDLVPIEEQVIKDEELKERLAGRLLLSVDEHGRLYYVDVLGELHALGSNAEQVQYNISKLALGINKQDLGKL